MANSVLTTRAVPEWHGRNPDTSIPPRVKARVFAAYDGICYLTERKIRAGEAWECEHIVALCNGGKHVESNLAPALVVAHREKTKADVKVKSKTERMRKKHLGIWPKPSRPLRSRNTFRPRQTELDNDT